MASTALVAWQAQRYRPTVAAMQPVVAEQFGQPDAHPLRGLAPVTSSVRSQMVYQARHPKLYEQWVTHDLAKCRRDFYEGLRNSDQPRVWEFIESNYLAKYRSLILVAFEWCADGMWGIPFPGSVDMGECLDPAEFGFPLAIAEELRAWHYELSAGSEPWEADDTFDYVASDASGLRVAKKIKGFLGAEYYVEFHPFRELQVDNGVVVELDVPEFITSITKTAET